MNNTVSHAQTGGGESSRALEPGSTQGSPSEVFWAFLKLGLTSFGGPIAHLGYFRDELVVRRKWLDETAYVDLVALCQFLPGPASSQVGFSLGILRGNGLLGGLAAWFAFTMPSALILFAFALGAAAFTGTAGRRFPSWPQARRRRGRRAKPYGAWREPLLQIAPCPASRSARLRSSWFSPDHSGRSRRSQSAHARAFGSARENPPLSPGV